MREIKFRVWNFKLSKMFSWEDMRLAKGENIWLWISVNKKQENNLLMQYTGLKDKNGKEIYEFDYVLDKHNQRILVEYEFSLLSRLKDIQKELILDGNYYE